MKTITILNLIILITINKIIACECNFNRTLRQIDSISYETSEIVILGRISKINQSQYSITVTKILKGPNIANSITGIYDKIYGESNSCSFYPKYEGEYLLYLDETISGKNNKYYYSSQCTGNRSINLSDCLYCEFETPQNETIKYTKNWINKLDEMRQHQKK